MVLSFAEQLSVSSTVNVVLSNSADDDESSAETIAASRVNPYMYSFHAPAGQQTRSHSVYFIYLKKAQIKIKSVKNVKT